MKYCNNDKRNIRKKQTGEVFTPPYLINKMLDKMLEYNPNYFNDITLTVIDPACGNGNMLIEVLKRKLQHTNSYMALSTIYGCDIMDDNIKECHIRLYNTCKEFDSNIDKDKLFKVMSNNIVCTPLDVYPNGSLDFLSNLENDTFKYNDSIIEGGICEI